MVGERKVIWKQITTTQFDKKRLEKERKEIYDEYVTKSQYCRGQIETYCRIAKGKVIKAGV